MRDTEMKETQVTRGAGEAVSRRRSGAGGAHGVAGQTESQLHAVGLLPRAVRPGRTLGHAGVVWHKSPQLFFFILFHFFF